MDCNTAVQERVTELAVEERRLAKNELRSPAKPQHFGGFTQLTIHITLIHKQHARLTQAQRRPGLDSGQARI